MKELEKPLKESRSTEIQKYVEAYKVPWYHAGTPRMEQSMDVLRSLNTSGSLLDVSCGRREFLWLAKGAGFDTCRGTEVVPGLIDKEQVVYAEAHTLPFDDNSFDVVTSWDVMEHLLPGDDEAACREMERVARKYVLLGISNSRGHFRRRTVLHINRRPYDEWDRLLKEWFSGEVCRMSGNLISETWVVKL